MDFNKKLKKYFYAIYFIVPSVLFILNIVFRGIKSSSDVVRNQSWAEKFASSEYNIFYLINYLIENRGVDGIQYFFSILIYSTSNLIENYSEVFIIFLNYFSFIFSIYLIFKIFENKKEYTNYIIFVPFILIFNYDYILWSSFILTDFIFAFLIIAFSFSLLKKNNIFFLILITLICIFTRPPGLVCILILFQYFLWKKFFSYESFINFYVKLILLIIFYFFIVFLISYFVWNDIYPDFLEKTFKYHQQYILDGIIIHDRPNTFVDIPVSSFAVFKIFFIRFFYFFVTVDKNFSLVHNIYNLFYYIPLYFFTIVAIINYFKLPNFEKELIFLLIVVIFSFTLFHSVLLIDYDWRYRLPCIVPNLIIGIIGFKYLIKKYLL